MKKKTTNLVAAISVATASIAALVFAGYEYSKVYVPPATPPKATVVFVVLDNVRADHLSSCGYERPTSPYLASLCESVAICSCSAYSPGVWTLPSHASYFTGLTVTQNGTGLGAGEEGVKLAIGSTVRGLSESHKTLAEIMQEQGYQTAAITANPVVAEGTGLLRGFQHIREAKEFGEYFTEGLQTAFIDLLRELDPNKPLFLFINVADAHEPWPKIPESVDWLSHPVKKGIVDPFRNRPMLRSAFTRGRITEDERSALIDDRSTVYDYGIHLADQNLEDSLDRLETIGWLEAGIHLVVTSDHGELLGEHNQLGHGGPYPYEGLVKVPLVVWSTEQQVSLSEPVSALTAFDLVQGLNHEREVSSAAYRNPGWTKMFGEPWGMLDGAALWDGHDKYVSIDGIPSHYDLSQDSGETNALPIQNERMSTRLNEIMEALDTQFRTPGDVGATDLSERLKALGYMEE